MHAHARLGAQSEMASKIASRPILGAERFALQMNRGSQRNIGQMWIGARTRNQAAVTGSCPGQLFEGGGRELHLRTGQTWLSSR